MICRRHIAGGGRHGIMFMPCFPWWCGCGRGTHLAITSMAPLAPPLPQCTWLNPLSTLGWGAQSLTAAMAAAARLPWTHLPARTHLTPPQWQGAPPGPWSPPSLEYAFPEGFATRTDYTMGDSNFSLLCARPQMTTKLPREFNNCNKWANSQIQNVQIMRLRCVLLNEFLTEAHWDWSQAFLP